MKTPNAFFRLPRYATGRAALAILGAAAAAILVFAPVAAEAQAPNRFAYGIYKCSASYTAEYSYVDTRVTGADFLGGRCVKFKPKFQYYMVVSDQGNLHFIYFDKRTLTYTVLFNCPYDCHDYLDLESPRNAKLTISGCSVQSALNIGGTLSVDGERCESFCLGGAINRRGNVLTIPPPGNNVPPGPFFSFAPGSLQGNYCRVTCYNTGQDRYVEGVLGMRDFSYTGPHQNAAGNPANGYGIACVTGNVTCRIDRALTIDFINNTDNGITTVSNYLNSQGYSSTVSVAWVFVSQFPGNTPPEFPFLP